MNETDAYREWAAPPAWRGVVACLWEQRVAAARSHRVVPDGCADVIVSSDGAVAVGTADGPVVHRLEAGWTCLGLRLRPEAVATFFGVPADELRNHHVPLDDVVGTRRARRVVDAVVDGVADERLLVNPPRRVRRALQLLVDTSVDHTADQLGMSTRQLRRLAVAHSGLGPKTYQRVARLRRFLDDDRPLAEAAVAAGYADQAHLTREVRRMCGIPPAALRVERGSVVERGGADGATAFLASAAGPTDPSGGPGGAEVPAPGR